MTTAQAMAKIATTISELMVETNSTTSPKEFTQKLCEISNILFGDEN